MLGFHDEKKIFESAQELIGEEFKENEEESKSHFEMLMKEKNNRIRLYT